MLIVDDDVFESHLRGEVQKTAQVIPIEHGRGIGTKNVPESLRKIIGDAGLEGESSKSITEVLPVSESSVSAYKKGATSTTTYHDPHPDLEQHLTTTKHRISKSATKKLEDALDGITPDKIAGAKLRDIASVARDMSQIVKNMEEGSDINNKGNTNIIFYTPNLRQAETFEHKQLED